MVWPHGKRSSGMITPPVFSFQCGKKPLVSSASAPVDMIPPPSIAAMRQRLSYHYWGFPDGSCLDDARANAYLRVFPNVLQVRHEVRQNSHEG